MRYKKVLLVCVWAVVTLYTVSSLMVDRTLSHAVLRANETLGADNTGYDAFADKDTFAMLCFRDAQAISALPDDNYTETAQRTRVYTLHNFLRAKSFYWYTYELYDDDELVVSRQNVPVTVYLSFDLRGWHITGYEEGN